MDDEFGRRLSEFVEDLERAERLLRFMQEFKVFGASAASQPADDADSWPEATSLGVTANEVRTDLPILAGALHLYVCGRFEFFVRELVVAVADKLGSDATSYQDLPEKLRSELFILTLDVAKNPKRYGYSERESHAFLSSLVSNLGGSKGAVEVRSEILSITESNLNPEALSDVMRRVGFASVWSEIGKQAPMKAHLGVRSDGESTQEAKNKLAAVMRERNSFAHPTSSTVFHDPDQVLGTCRFLSVLSSVLCDIARMPAT